MILAPLLIVVALVASTVPETHQSALSSLWKDIVSLGTEDVKWQEYGEFGLLFAPAEYLVSHAGFKYKQHYVTTEDGYILELIHVINPLADQSQLKKIPIVLSHGFSQAAYNFVCQSVNKTKAIEWPRKTSSRWHRESDRNLGVLLANNGYDVWLVTSRGSLCSTRPNLKLHKMYSTHQPHFWHFSLDDQAKYDVPAWVNGVIKLTGSEKVVFVGYSQSTFTMFGHLSLKPEFAKKIHTFVAVAPITSMFHGSGLLRPLGALVKSLVPELVRDFSFPPIEIGRILTKLIFLLYSLSPRVVHSIMAFIYNLFFGNNGGKAYDGLLLLARLLRYPTSFRGLLQFMQVQFTEKMSHYDYGGPGNMEHYMSSEPPPYNLSNIEHDGIAMYIGENDCLSDSEDNRGVVKLLRFPPIVYKVIPVWNHLDYVFGKNMDIMLNRPILRLLDKRVV